MSNDMSIENDLVYVVLILEYDIGRDEAFTGKTYKEFQIWDDDHRNKDPPTKEMKFFKSILWIMKINLI